MNYENADFQYGETDAETEQIKLPPHSVQAEQAVVGGLMLDNEAWDKVADKVVETDFYRREHRHIFEAIRNLADVSSPFDVVTLAEALERSESLDDVGGLPYLISLANDTPSAANIEAYADIVRKHSIVRQLIRVGTDIADSGYRPEGKTVEQLLDHAESKVFNIAEQTAKSQAGFQHIKDLLVKALDKIETLQENDSMVTGVPSGFTDYDMKTSGLQPSDLIIVAGRPSMGKTTFAMNMAENVAVKTGEPVAVFSMEMPGDALAMRMISSLGRVDQSRLRTGDLDDDEWPRITSAVNILMEAKLLIDDTPALTPSEVRARSRRLAREHGKLSLIVLDYLQLMQGNSGGENRATEISEISRSLKALAKEMDCPVIALSQLNRNLEQRPNKRPVMSDLRESGSIEQDADVIVFIYRDEVYNEDSADKGLAEIIIGKQRNGPIGTVRLTFQGQFTRFDNFVADTYGDQEY